MRLQSQSFPHRRRFTPSTLGPRLCTSQCGTTTLSTTNADHSEGTNDCSLLIARRPSYHPSPSFLSTQVRFAAPKTSILHAAARPRPSHYSLPRRPLLWSAILPELCLA
ncbi:hypothetical protein GALMADRAFT_1140879 [Galerina marginata CBS 339.88]|uniref:Uncharacterized protein n=1 Tax=Galerina marginata (strain CBS 339.88) TaxID=685588 RepID=A0A067SJ44_GALM3|nr:hypothetical protein GALMADRAFT_1140879 [Galerina marginata CBS 339.88]